MDTTNMTIEEQIAALQAENAKLKEKAAKRSTISFKVSEKGACSVYGLGRFPCSLYVGQWERLIAALPELQAFLAANVGKLTTKE